MSLVILCGCLEPGADGVGDYSRRLAAAFLRLGKSACLLALHDPRIDHPQQQLQKADGLEIPVLRLPISLSWSRRLALAQEQLQLWQARQLSLQYVPYSFASRGLPGHLPGLIQALRSPAPGQPPLSLQLMLHELWLGLAAGSNVRSRALGQLQRLLIQRLYNLCQPRAVHTTAGTYQQSLQSIGIPAERLPLFSNLPGVAAPQPMPEDLFTGCVFGRVPPQWEPEPVLQALIDKATQQQRRARLLFIGHAHRPRRWFTELQRRWPQLSIENAGPDPSAARVAGSIAACQVGLATTPWALIEKSGSAAAFLSLGLPVVVSRDDWRLRQRYSRAGSDGRLPEYPNLLRLSSWLTPSVPRLPYPYRPATPDEVAGTLLASLAL